MKIKLTIFVETLNEDGQPETNADPDDGLGILAHLEDKVNSGGCEEYIKGNFEFVNDEETKAFKGFAKG